MGSSLTLTDAIDRAICKYVLFMKVSKVTSLCHKRLWEILVKCLVVNILNAKIVIDLKGSSSGSEQLGQTRYPRSTVSRMNYHQETGENDVTHYVGETVVHSIQIGRDCLEERGSSGRKIFEDDTSVPTVQVQLEILK